jgi:hypothetical protein
VFHVRGGSWAREAQGLTAQYLGGVWGTGTGASQEVYAVGAGGVVLHRSGGTWTTEAAGLSAQQLNAVVGVGPDEFQQVRG